MAIVEARLAELSSKADALLDKHQHVLSKLGLSITFNRSTLATKYWLPLPDVEDLVSTASIVTPISGNEYSGQTLARILEEGVRYLERFDELAEQNCMNAEEEQVGDDLTGSQPESLRKVPPIIEAFTRAVCEVTKIIDNYRDMYGSPSDNDEDMSIRLSPGISLDKQQATSKNLRSISRSREMSKAFYELLGTVDHRAQQTLPSERLPDIFAGYEPPDMRGPDRSDHSSPTLNRSADPHLNHRLVLEHLNLDSELDVPRTYSGPQLSPKLVPQQNKPPDSNRDYTFDTMPLESGQLGQSSDSPNNSLRGSKIFFPTYGPGRPSDLEATEHTSPPAIRNDSVPPAKQNSANDASRGIVDEETLSSPFRHQSHNRMHASSQSSADPRPISPSQVGHGRLTLLPSHSFTGSTAGYHDDSSHGSGTGIDGAVPQLVAIKDSRKNTKDPRIAGLNCNMDATATEDSCPTTVDVDEIYENPSPDLVKTGCTIIKKKRIEDFEILEIIGQGAYAQVKLACYKKPAAKKMIVKYVNKRRILVDTWHRSPRLGTVPLEIHVLDHLRRSGLQHPNIVEMADFFEDDINYYIEMIPHGLPATDLFDYIELRVTMDECECRKIFKQVAEALRHLHLLAKVVHRDIKDENVILDNEGTVKLVDFGSAAYIKSGPFDVFVGTIDYAAPEVLQGRSYRGKEQDVWALGILLYTIVYKENPFHSIDEITCHDLRVPWAPSEECIDLIRKMLDRDVDRRIGIQAIVEHPWCLVDKNIDAEHSDSSVVVCALTDEEVYQQQQQEEDGEEDEKEQQDQTT